MTELAKRFEQRFGRAAHCGTRAPGRINLIGEHTDYNDGLVLPCAIDRDTVVLASPRDDRCVRVFSRELDEERRFQIGAAATRTWVDYVHGVIQAFEAEALTVGGLDLAIASDVPIESGLSSSASVCVAIAAAVDRCFAFDLGPLGWARLAHRGESEFAGVGCGIMDSYASSLAQPGAALRIDCRSRQMEAVPLPTTLGFLVAHSGVRRSLVDGRYGERRAMCHEAFLAARSAGIAAPEAVALRDLAPDDLPALSELLSPVQFRRVRHVITENQRVDAACRALRAGDCTGVGAVLSEGMRSLERDFEVSIPELDFLCELADATPGVYGSRLTGAGFGGCSLHLVDRLAAPQVAVSIASGFEQRFGRRPELLHLSPSRGASVLLPDR